MYNVFQYNGDATATGARCGLPLIVSKLAFCEISSVALFFKSLILMVKPLFNVLGDTDILITIIF